jgi:hypothetical protein
MEKNPKKKAKNCGGISRRETSTPTQRGSKLPQKQK